MRAIQEFIKNIEAPATLVWKWLKVILLLTVLIFAGLLVWRVYSSLTDRSFGEAEAFRMLIVSLDEEEELDRVVTLHYLPDMEQLVYLELPRNTRITAGEYGEYTLRGLYRLDRVEKAQGTLLHEAVERELGVLLLNHMTIRQEEELERILSKPQRMGWKMLQRGFVGEQNILDASVLWREWRSMDETRVEYIRLNETSVLEEVVALDGVKEWSVNTLRMDDMVRRAIMPSVPELAALGVVVENATGRYGLAGNWSRFVVSEGYDLINVTDAESSQKQSSLLFASEEARDSFGGEHLQKMFPDFLVAVTDLQVYRSDAVLRLGSDVVF